MTLCKSKYMALSQFFAFKWRLWQIYPDLQITTTDNPCVLFLKRCKIMISYGKLVLICSVLLLINFVVLLNRWITNPHSAHRCEMTISFLVRVWQEHGRAMPIWFSIQINYILVLLHNLWFNSYLASLIQMAEWLELKSMRVCLVHF